MLLSEKLEGEKSVRLITEEKFRDELEKNLANTESLKKRLLYVRYLFYFKTSPN